MRGNAQISEVLMKEVLRESEEEDNGLSSKYEDLVFTELEA